MKYRPLGSTGVQVSAVGLGGNQFGSTVDAAATKAIIDKAIELGVNFIDSAESYSSGASEEVLGKALKGRWNDVVLATSFLTGKYALGATPPPDTRFGRRPQAAAQYLTPEQFAKLEKWRAFAESRGHSVGELAIAWLLAKPVVCSVIAGVTKPEQVE